MDHKHSVQQLTFTKAKLTLTLYLLVLAADNFCKQFGPRTGRHFVGPDLDPDCLRLL